MVCPSTEKLDLERFARDLPKYKPWLSAESWSAWENFLDTYETISVVNTDVYWMLPDLQQARIAMRTTSQVQPPITLSEEAQLLLDKENRTPKKVLCIYWYYSSYV